jgi:hypothetical protein
MDLMVMCNAKGQTSGSLNLFEPYVTVLRSSKTSPQYGLTKSTISCDDTYRETDRSV